MRRILPSPIALLAFEASARLLSFKQAAEDLNVSAAAISRHIRNLETYVGRPLFLRHHRRVELTEVGKRLFVPVNQGFAGMAVVLAELKAGEGERQVTIGSTGGFAYYWLMPRLARFSEVWPDIVINQIVSDEKIDMSDGQVDLVVRYGAGQWPGLESRLLFNDTIYPVCSPAYLRAVDAPQSIGDLADHPLFDVHGIVGDHWVDWETWFRYAGHPTTGVRRRFLNYLIGVQMAVDGHGFVLGWDRFVGNLVDDGLLVKPFDTVVRSPGAFFLTFSSGQPTSPEASLFMNWLLQEAVNNEPSAH